MDKETYYFSHDYNARNDPKIVKLRMKFGWEGYGLFWGIVEKLREQPDFRLSIFDYDAMAYEFNCDVSILHEVMQYCISDQVKLFESDDSQFWSESLLRRMEKKELIRKKKAEGGRKAMEKRWRKEDQGDKKPEPEKEKPKQGKPKEKKIKYADFVSMREKDHQALIDRFGDKATGRMIEILSNYKGSKGKTYKDDYRAILNWVVERYKDEQLKEVNRNNHGKTNVERTIEARRRIDEEFLNY